MLKAAAAEESGARNNSCNLRVEKPRAALLAALKECCRSRDLIRSKRLHAQAIERGLFSHKFVVNSVINTYAKCGSMEDARKVFDAAANFRDVVPWTSLISGYVENGECELALELFDRMRDDGRVLPDARVYVAALSACASLGDRSRKESQKSPRSDLDQRWLAKGRRIHSQLVSSNCSADAFLVCTLVDMYSKCGSLDEAKKIFDEMLQHRDVMTWNALLQGYVDNGESELAVKLFDRMQDEPNFLPNARTFTAAVSACASAAAKHKESQDDDKELSKMSRNWYLEKGKSIHSRISSRNKSSSTSSSCGLILDTALIDMYAKCGCIELARRVFDGMIRKDVVAWTSLIMGYVESDENELALDLVSAMVSSGITPDSSTFAAALIACGNLMALKTGKDFHDAIRSCRDLETNDVVVGNCLIDFYGKCGSTEAAELVFDSMRRKTVVSWTSLMGAYSLRGDFEGVFRLFRAMKEQGVKANEVTFVCLLSACSHAGLTDQGKEYFRGMRSVYGVVPRLKHYNCVIDLLCRANQVEEAIKLVSEMPYEANDVTWTSLLGACRKFSDARNGKAAFECLLGGKHASAYVLMADTLRNRVVCGRSLWTDECGKVHYFDG